MDLCCILGHYIVSYVLNIMHSQIVSQFMLLLFQAVELILTGFQLMNDKLCRFDCRYQQIHSVCIGCNDTASA